MATKDITQKLSDIKIKDNQDINILLLGETGVGKSTFINSIANYFHFKSFKKALKAEELLVLIPAAITITNDNFEQVTLTIGSDNNEFLETGAAATQDVKTYVFPIGEGKTRLRLIDSPGMGDPRGIDQDDINCENILAYLSQLKELHGICFVMRPTNTRKTVLFEYCVKQILSRLEKSASRNIIFVFTNTRGSNYTPGDTLGSLKRVIDDIKAKPPHVDIPLSDNVFAVDNEAFRFLVAMKNGMSFKDDIQERFIESWNNASKECWRMISYIVGDTSRDGLKPHQLLNTISINEARRIIVQLSQPLADITQLIHDNLRILGKHRAYLRMENQSLDDLKKKLFIPIINLKVMQLTQPVTICTSTKCAELVKVGEVSKWHYRQRCHDPCYLTNVAKEIVGDENLRGCAAMGGRTCMKCTCDYQVHMHVYYMTTPVDDRIEDEVVKKNVNRKEEAVRESERLISQIDQRKRELENERDVIIKSTAQFAHFLQHNAISPFNDSYKAYIEYLISRENGLGRNSDKETICHLQQLLQRYEEMKAAFDNSLQFNQATGLDSVVSSTVTPQSVLNTISGLYALKHTGKMVKDFLEKQKASREMEYNKNCEYVHPKASDLSAAESKKEKSKKDGKKSTKSGDEKKDEKPKKYEASKKKDKDKDSGKSTDDDRRNRKGPPQRSFQQQPRYQNQFPPQHFHPQNQWQEPPPPYESSTQRTRYFTPNTQQSEPNVVVNVELTSRNRSDQGYSSDRPHNSYQNYPSYQHQPPYQSQPPYQNQLPYQNQRPYQNQPPNQHGPYSGPGYNYGAPNQFQGPPHFPPNQQWNGPPGNYNYQPPPQGYHQGQGVYQGQYQRNSGPQGQRGGRPFNKKKGSGKRDHSKPRNTKGKKNDSGKSGQSSDSDS